MLLGLAGILVVFGVFSSVVNVDLASPSGIGILLGAVVAAVLFFFVSRFGYRYGRDLGENMRDDE